MHAFVKSILLSVAALVLFSGAALTADLPAMPRAKAPDGFERLGADCLEATDGCRRFVRAGDGRFDATNNIGIACQPNLLSCTKRK